MFVIVHGYMVMFLSDGRQPIPVLLHTLVAKYASKTVFLLNIVALLGDVQE